MLTGKVTETPGSCERSVTVKSMRRLPAARGGTLAPSWNSWERPETVVSSARSEAERLAFQSEKAGAIESVALSGPLPKLKARRLRSTEPPGGAANEASPESETSKRWVIRTVSEFDAAPSPSSRVATNQTSPIDQAGVSCPARRNTSTAPSLKGATRSKGDV